MPYHHDLVPRPGVAGTVAPKKGSEGRICGLDARKSAPVFSRYTKQSDLHQKNDERTRFYVHGGGHITMSFELALQ